MDPSAAPGTRATPGAGFVTEGSVYGLILVAGMIAVTGRTSESSWQIFWTVGLTVVVFWAAHVFAGTIAHVGVGSRGHRPSGVRDALRLSLRNASGLLIAAIIPSAVLLLGASHLIDDESAMWGALWSDVVLLAILGYIAFARRGATAPGRILGGLATMVFGIVMVLLKTFIH